MWAEIIERQHTQAAADSAAYSAAVWQARGMNTICTCNHLMGELTSLVVILESLGGPEAGENPFNPPQEEQQINNSIKNLKDTGLVGSQTKTAISFSTFDKKFVDLLYDFFIKKHTRHYCGAAIYDAEITLKKRLEMGFIVKIPATIIEIVGNIIKMIPVIGTAIGTGIEAIGTGIHVLVDIELGTQILPEMIKLRILEQLVSAIAPVKDIARLAIPVLGIFTDEIAGVGITEGAVQTSVLDTAKRVQQFYGMSAITVIPRNLPLIQESAPSTNSKTKMRPYSPWGGSDKQSSFLSVIDTVIGIIQNLRKIPLLIPVMNKNCWFTIATNLDDYYDILKARQDRIDGLSKWQKRLAKRLALNDLEKEFLEKYGLFKEKADQINNTTSDGYSWNPSLKRLAEFDVEEERITQFARATNPYVDSLRAEMRGWFCNEMPCSNISSYFTHWTYRYVLNESYCLRSGEYGLPAHMLVLEGWDPKKKGNESWTDNPVIADQTFSVIAGVLSPKRKPVFSPRIYARSRPTGDVAIAQAMFYNLNGRDAQADSSGIRFQPATGWDTLQWEPVDINGNINASEWKKEPYNKHGSRAPWGIFSERSISSHDPARVKLNWQTKLRPVTQYGAEQLVNAPDVDPVIKRISGVTADHSVLLSH
jgi:hypothetical protein